ncbi:F-box protein PP2-B13-like [Lotus japonicus]|uniref:F-box protein PP2-B13-like n=1 Tax=Lotus japonicus TaxID=34305 RepID=UPI002588A30D|nr:F-box protein PP2-B13-like [Lotus japonicus]
MVQVTIVSKILCSAADSDVVWEHFLPCEYNSIVSQSPSLANTPLKKFFKKFSEVAKLWYVWWLEIIGTINTLFLSLNTQYGAFLVFKIKHYFDEFRDYPVELSVKNVGSGQSITKDVCSWDPYLDARRQHSRQWRRSDGWLEIEMGEFFTSDLEGEEFHMSVTEIQGYKSGLILEGIEVRPKKHN